MRNLLLLLLTVCLTACAGSQPLLRQVDDSLVFACEVLAQQLAARSNADAKAIIATSCAVEGFTRTLRETMLSQQLQAAQAAGVAVPDISSGALEDDAGVAPAQ